MIWTPGGAGMIAWGLGLAALVSTWRPGKRVAALGCLAVAALFMHLEMVVCYVRLLSSFSSCCTPRLSFYSSLLLPQVLLLWIPLGVVAVPVLVRVPWCRLDRQVGYLLLPLSAAGGNGVVLLLALDGLFN